MRIFLVLLSWFVLCVTCCSITGQLLCHSLERSALLEFKESFVLDPSCSEPSSKLASWVIEGGGDNCCSWNGVECCNETGHVIGLNLGRSCLYGSIASNNGLFRLVHLQKLDLSKNNFNYSHIPTSIEQLYDLRYLNLSLSSFYGIIPHELGNLTKLQSLNLSFNNLSGRIPSSLERLTQLQFLQLSYNDFSDTTLSWVGKQNKITYLDLSGINLSGTLLPSIVNLTKIVELYLGENQLSGVLPPWLGNFTQLTTLYLSLNKLQGSIPKTFSQLMNLENLYLYQNNLSGTVELSMFLKLKNLIVLYLAANELTVFDDQATSPNATLPQFKELGLGLCKLHEFPNFLRYQVQMKWLDLSENNIHHQIPRWLLEVSKNTLEVLILKNNLLNGFERPSLVLPFHRLIILSISNNRLQGEIPIPPRSIVFYRASNNSFTGEISPLICSLNSLVFLDLSYNNLHGSLPPCLGSYKRSRLTQSPQTSTYFPRDIENSLDVCKLRLINLSQNRLQGTLPKPLANCTRLQYFDMSNNQINDTFPFWLGTLPDLKVVLLHSNQFHGQLTRPSKNKKWFAKLHIFDISNNQFYGYLSSNFFQGWSFMKTIPQGQLNYLQAFEFLLFSGDRWWRVGYNFSMTIMNKGSSINYQKTQNFFISMGLSSNKFEGNIPESIGNLRGVKSLNISNNNLSGSIPWTLKNMTELESLDLSQNQLSGEIPQQLANLNYLGTFKVSHNHLEGPIPGGRQFEAFPSYYFDGNPGLCGPPLSRKCKLSAESSNSLHRTIQGEEEKDSDSRSSVEWKEVVLGYGFGVFIGITCGMMFTRKRREWFEATSGSMWNQRRRREHSSRRRRR